MRVYCPNCKQMHDVPIRAVLAEAERLRQLRGGQPAGSRRADPSLPDADGNTLTPEEIDRAADKIEHRFSKSLKRLAGGDSSCQHQFERLDGARGWVNGARARCTKCGLMGEWIDGMVHFDGIAERERRGK